jgi:hypothetical protein
MRSLVGALTRRVTSRVLDALFVAEAAWHWMRRR